MHPYVIDRMVRERQDVLSQMAQAEHRVRAARWASYGRPERSGGDRHLAAFAVAMVAFLARRWTMRAEPRPQPAGRPC